MSNRKTSPFITKLSGYGFRRAERLFQTRSQERAERLGAKLGDLGWRVDKKHRYRTLANVELAYPELSPAERETMAHEVWRHFGRTTADFMRADIRTPEDVLSSIVEVEGWEFAEEALSRGKGVLLISAHFGNWERMSHYLGLRGMPLTVVARAANNEVIEDGMQRKRLAEGVEVLNRGDTTRTLLRRLSEGRVAGLLPDQNCEESFLPFFGHLTGTVTGPAILHLRTEAPLLPAFCPQVGPGKWKVVVRPPVDLPNEN